MSRMPRTLLELRREGFRAPVDPLGPINAIRCLHQFHLGQGDDAAERDQLLGLLNMEGIVRGIEEMRRREQAESERA